MTNVTTNTAFDEPRTMIAAAFNPFQAVRTACGDFVRSRRRSQEVFHMTQVLNRLNDRQLSALGLARGQLYRDIEERYDGSVRFVDEVISIVDEQTEPKALSHDPSVMASSGAYATTERAA